MLFLPNKVDSTPAASLRAMQRDPLAGLTEERRTRGGRTDAE